VEHCLPPGLSNSKKLLEAKKILKRYQDAKYVITSRLHCALPCLAFGIPVLFLLPKMEKDVRFDSTFLTLLGKGNELPKMWNWEKPEIEEEKMKLIQDIREIHKREIFTFLNKV
jgi:exopolysaccharide biosynthesis predicted pyruvyltransferase EpsI